MNEEKAQKDMLAAFVGENKNNDSDDNDNDDEKVYVDPEGLTIEQRVRKERPPSRIRFAESAQPDYVMMALDGVGLMYGNQVVLKDASFAVTTGERIGLVGPNGGGKVILICSLFYSSSCQDILSMIMLELFVFHYYEVGITEFLIYCQEID